MDSLVCNQDSVSAIESVADWQSVAEQSRYSCHVRRRFDKYEFEINLRKRAESRKHIRNTVLVRVIRWNEVQQDIATSTSTVLVRVLDGR